MDPKTQESKPCSTNERPVEDLDADELQEEMETLLKRVIVKELRRALISDESANASLLGHADRYLQRRKGGRHAEDDDGILAELRRKASRSMDAE